MAPIDPSELQATPAPAALNLLVTDEKVRQAVEQLVAAANPLQVIAFGSWARRELGPHSDLDLAVILDGQSVPTPKGGLRASIRVPMSVDVLAMTVAELQQKSLRLNSVHRDIVEDGIVMYQRSGAFVPQGTSLPSRKDLLDVKVDEVKLALKKAHSDEEALGLERLSPQIAAFHGQQAIEKLLKAWLIALDVAPPKTHELDRLEDALQDLGKPVPDCGVALKTFNDYAVRWRYSDIPDAEQIDLAAMRATVARLRAFVLTEIVAILPEIG